MKKYAASWVLALTLFTGEVHTFWEKHGGDQIVNWIWKNPRPMALQWNIKYLSLQVNYSLWFLAMYLYGFTPNRVNKTTVITFLWFSLIDTFAYFYNYKTYYYGAAYLIFTVIWLLVYYWLEQCSRRRLNKPKK